MNNKQKFLDLLNELDDDCLWRYMDFKYFLGKEACNQYVENCFNPGSVEMSYPVLMDLNGNFMIHAATAAGSKTMSELSENTIRLFEIPCYIKNDFCLDESSIYDLDDNETDLLYSSLNDEEKEFFDDLEEFYYAAREEYFQAKYKEVFPNKFKELFKEYAMESFHWNIEDGLSDQLENVKQTLENDLENEFKNIGDMPF